MSFDECENVIRDNDPEDVEGEEQPEPAELIDLFRTGNEPNLSAEACDGLLRDRGAIVVAILAGPETGKTTLIATMYELLRRRQLNAFGFAGSETIRGLEERCHLSRGNSDGDKADTKRTSGRLAVNFAHLRVAANGGHFDIVFSDRSGEHFERVYDKPDTVAEFGEVARADILVLVVDAFLLATDPHPETSRARKMFLALQQAGLLEAKPLLLVATKTDLLTVEMRADAQTRVSALEEEFCRRAPGLDLRPLMTSARPKAGETSFGEGFRDLLTHFVPVEPKREFEIPRPLAGPSAGIDQLLSAWS